MVKVVRNQSTFLPFNITSDKIPQKFTNELYLSELINKNIYHTYNSIYSVKYQISGTEIYKVGSHEITLEENNYLVVNNNQFITSLPYKTEKAISIFIEPSTINDVFYNLKENDESLLANPFDYRSEQISFYENTLFVKDDLFGITLKSLADSFNEIKDFPDVVKKEYFYKFSRNLILSQQETFKQIKSIDCVKFATKVELINRMKYAEYFLIDNWNQGLSLDTVSSVVSMSPYHFHRTFTKTFNVSPLSFHLKIRMKKSKELLAKKTYRISDVAYLAGYSDIFSFSKAFKKHYGFSPSKASVQNNQ